MSSPTVRTLREVVDARWDHCRRGAELAADPAVEADHAKEDKQLCLEEEMARARLAFETGRDTAHFSLSKNNQS